MRIKHTAIGEMNNMIYDWVEYALETAWVKQYWTTRNLKDFDLRRDYDTTFEWRAL